MNLALQIWHGCYDKSLKGFITDQSFGHPAKYSLGLIERIFDHCLKQGYLKRGDTVGDCFGGVCIGGLVAAYRGLEWCGVELEPRFVKWCEDNIELHRSKFKALGVTPPRIIQGDSRRFHILMGENDAIVSSPPFAGTSGQGGGGINKNGYVPAEGRKWTGDKPDPVGARTYQGQGGQREPGNIETLKEGSVEAVVSSPPYAVISTGAGGLNTKPAKHEGQQSGRSAKAASQDTDQKYGTSDGQIARLKGGDVQAVVTSPPFEDRLQAQDPKYQAAGPGHGPRYSNYGDSEGQIGKEKAENYWEAMNVVYRQCFKAIRPGGVIVLVVKNYVKNRKVVPLCDDTMRLIEHIGFEPLERIHAMLTSETRHGDLFDGETVKTKSRKSFFRRLAERNGSPAINFEEVLIARRPL